MMKQRLFMLFAVLMASFAMATTLQAQRASDYHDFKQRGELYFTFKVPSVSLINEISQIISVDNFDPASNEVAAYASEKEFEAFLKYQLPFEMPTAPSMLLESVSMYDISKGGRNNWDTYPTYESYISMMQGFQSSYPNLCTTTSIGKSVKNRDLLVCKITSSANEGKKPRVFYTSTMHGDETTGYVLMLRLIDYLLSNYASNPRIKAMLDNTEIWINPLANPDGTYKVGNHTVQGSTRYNANYVDLNRNFKDDKNGDHPDGNAWQPETVAFQDFLGSKQFTLGANLHGGIEVVNYPWDNKYALHADNDWFLYISRAYADTCHTVSNYYMTGLQNGVTNGAAWYVISGSRQDNANYFHRNREITLEVSDTKLLPASQLPRHWDLNYKSLLNLIEEANYGIHGVVTANGQPVKCEVSIKNHDKLNSSVFTDLPSGYYARPIKAGTYTVIYKAEGYPEAERTVTVIDRQKLVMDVELVSTNPIQAPVADFDASPVEITVGESVQFTDKSTNEPTSWEWSFEGGTPSTSTQQNPSVKYTQVGEFTVTLKVSNEGGNNTLSREKYIKVKAPIPAAPVANFDASSLEIFEGETVSFQDKSSNEPTAWQWIFEGAAPATSTDQNPTVMYNNEGTYSVTLTVSNEGGSNTLKKDSYIKVKKPTSIDEAVADASIRVMVQDNLIEVYADSSIKSIDLIDLQGKLVLRQAPNSEQASIALSQVQKGIYMIRIESATNTKVQKLAID